MRENATLRTERRYATLSAVLGGAALLIIAILAVCAAPVSATDITFGTNGGTNWGVGYNAANLYGGQSFTVPGGGTVTSVTLQVETDGTLTDNIWFAITDDSSGAPGSTVFTNDSFAASGISATPENRTFDLTDKALNASTTYWLYYGRSGATSTSNYVVMYVNNAADSYTNGSHKRYASGSWAALNYDLDGKLTYSSSSATPTIAVTANAPTANDHSNNATSAFAYNYTLHDFAANTTDCYLMLNTSGTPWIGATQTGLSGNSSAQINATLNETTYTWAINCTSTGANATAITSYRTLVIDRTSPVWNPNSDSDVTRSTNTSIFNIHQRSNNLLFNMTGTDTNLWGYTLNLSYGSNGTVYQSNVTTSINGTNYNVSQYYSLSSLLSNLANVQLNWTVQWSDDHTARTIQDYANIVDLPNRQLRYVTDAGVAVNITAVTASRVPTALATWKETDRYRWQFNWTSGGSGNRTATIRLTSNKAITNRGNRYPYPAFVIGPHWVDFNIIEGASYTVTPNGAGFDIGISSASNTWTFASIGGLNYATETGYFNASAEPPGVNDLAASSTTTDSTILTYTAPFTTGNLTNTTEQASANTCPSYSQENKLFVNSVYVLQTTHSWYAGFSDTAYMYVRYYYDDGRVLNTSNISTDADAYTNITIASPDSTSKVTNITVMFCGNVDGAGTSYIMNDSASYRNYSYGSTLFNETGGVLYNGSNMSVNVNASGLSSSTTYTFYVDTWYNNSGAYIYNTTNTTGADVVSTTTLYNGTASVTIKNEVTNEVLTGPTISVSFIGPTNTTSTTTTGTVSISNLTDGTYTIRHSADGWGLRDQYLTVNVTAGSNLTVYLINDTYSVNGVVQVRDTQGDYVEGAIVKLLRYYGAGNSYNTVQMATTQDNLGEAGFTAQAYYAYYKWIIEYNGVTEYASSNPETLTPDSSGLWRKYFVIDIGNDFYSSFRGSTSTYTSLAYNNSTRAVTFTWNDAAGLTTQGCVYCRYANGSRWEDRGSCGAGSSGSVVQVYSTANATTHMCRGYRETSTTYSEPVDKTLTLDADKLFDFGTSGAFIGVFGMVIGGALMFSYSAIAVILWSIFSVAALSISQYFHLLPFGLGFVIGFATLGLGFIVYLMRR